MHASPFFTLPLIVFQSLVICGFTVWRAYRLGVGRAQPSQLLIRRAEIGGFMLARGRFLEKLDQSIDGQRYLGAGSAMLLHRQLDLGSLRPLTVETQGLYRTADSFYFLLKGEFRAHGEHSDLTKAWIEPLTHDQAKDWALRYSNGIDVSHV